MNDVALSWEVSALTLCMRIVHFVWLAVFNQQVAQVVLQQGQVEVVCGLVCSKLGFSIWLPKVWQKNSSTRANARAGLFAKEIFLKKKEIYLFNM